MDWSHQEESLHNQTQTASSCVALLARDGVEPERLEDLVAPSHVNTQVDRTVRTRVELPLRDLLLELV